MADSEIEGYLISDGVPDNMLIPYDVIASKAHASMLMSIGILTEEECASLLEGLEEIVDLYERGEFVVGDGDEDCHTAIERFLTEKYGDAGKKIHTGRSRNDQVLAASRLMMKGQVTRLMEASKELAKDFLTVAKKYQNVPFPGYSHSQQAMLSSLGHYFSSFCESLLDDRSMQGMAMELIDQNPLGSAAGFGVAFPLDREATTKAMGFSRVQQNSLYCQTSRGKFESFVLESLVQTMLTLGRFAQDMIIYTTQEFDYFSVDEAMTTGSSIMPQKKNLDYMEVLRGYVSVVISYQHQVQDLAKNQLSGYNKDLKFVKIPIIKSFEIVMDSLKVVSKMLKGITPNEEVIEAKLSKGIFAADVANKLVKEKGLAFRDAYVVVMEEIGKMDFDFEENLRSKLSLGAPGNLNLEKYEDEIKRM